jgi:hypothetical protein
MNLPTGIAVDAHPGDGLYVAGHITNGPSMVIRCTKEGDCPSL